ncbi:MAG: hypothetical protein HY673_16600 [Chloroflexi bacterium]|nr:hypothetical protein [Chloroflexota bacterium]
MAGIHEGEDKHEWIRPTRQVSKKWRGLDKADLYDTQGRLITEVGNIVEWKIEEELRAQGPHIEDCHHPENGTKILRKRLSHSQFLGVLAKYEHFDSRDFSTFLGDSRSLILIRPDAVDAVALNRLRVDGGFQPRMVFRFAGYSVIDGQLDYPVTDLKRVDFCQGCLKEGSNESYSYGYFRQKFGLRMEYLILGSGQWYRGRHWPLIIGVVCNKPLPPVE